MKLDVIVNSLKDEDFVRNDANISIFSRYELEYYANMPRPARQPN